MRNLTKLFCVFCLIGYGTAVRAQSALPATGSNASGTGGSVSYSVGQVVFTTSTGSNGSVAHGVQQPFEISVLTETEHAIDINIVFSAYPNPAGDFIILRVENYDKEKLSYQLFNSYGKLIENKKVTGFETTILVGNLLPAIYFLKIIDNQKEIKIFKIIKH